MSRCSCFHEVRTEWYCRCTAFWCLVEAASVAIHQIAFHLLAHIVRHEAVIISSNYIQLFITDTDSDIRFGDEADGLLVELGRGWGCRFLCRPLAAEVELVVGLTWEADDIRFGGSQKRIFSIATTSIVVCLIGVGIGIQKVLPTFLSSPEAVG